MFVRKPQSAVMAGLKVVPVQALSDGSLDLDDLKTKAEKHRDNLAAFMVKVFSVLRMTFLTFPNRLRILLHLACLRLEYKM